MEISVTTLSEFEAEAVRFARSLKRDPHQATLITLSGELGAGKTAFTKAIAKTFGVEETVTSPTFVLEKAYRLPAGTSFEHLIHIDAYRLESGTELSALGFEELMRNSGTLILLEWPEKVAGALPVPTTRLSIAVRTDGSRVITYG